MGSPCIQHQLILQSVLRGEVWGPFGKTLMSLQMFLFHSDMEESVTRDNSLPKKGAETFILDGFGLFEWDE